MGKLSIRGNGGTLNISHSGPNKILETQDFKYIRNTVKDIPSIPTLADGDVLYIKGYHEVGDQGGGLFVWDPNEPKANHNGGTVIDPSKAFPSDWSDETLKDSWFNTTNEGTGCWKRVFDGAVNVSWFGAVGDGEMDDTKAIQKCINNASKIMFDSHTYYISSIVLPNTTKHMKGNNTIILVNSTDYSPIIYINNNSSDITDGTHIIDGFYFKQKNNLYGTAIKISDSQRQTIVNCKIEGFNTAVLLFNNNIWTEATSISNCEILNCKNGISFSKGTSNYASFSSTKLDHILISNPQLSDELTYGIFINTGASIYRTLFNQVIIFADSSDTIAFYADGDLKDIYGFLSIEGNNSNATNTTGIKLDTNCENLNMDMFLDIRGNVTNKYVFNFSSPQFITGLKETNENGLSLGTAEIIKSGVATHLKQVVNDSGQLLQDIVVTESGSLERKSTQGECIVIDYNSITINGTRWFDNTTNTYKGWGKYSMLFVHEPSPENTGAKTGATPSVLGENYIELQQSAATDVTDLPDGKIGQRVIVKVLDGNSTFKNTPNGHFRLTGGTDYNPSAGTIIEFVLFDGDWIEISQRL